MVAVPCRKIMFRMIVKGFKYGLHVQEVGLVITPMRLEPY
jgi:hypothetical protein